MADYQLKKGSPMARIKSSQKSFTEEEVANLRGIYLDHLRGLVQISDWAREPVPRKRLARKRGRTGSPIRT
jgi:hypothetical protein